ncbi:MAG: ATP synthase subunit I [Acidobacteriota bacterium]|nr:ATP synthase subunit I [Acidobacteriota bacterium]
MQSESDYAAIERRMEAFVVAAGAVIAIVAAAGWGWRAGLSAAAGLLLCWVNIRWLREGAGAVVRLGLAQAGVETVRVPKSVHAKFFGRLLLLLVAAYAMLVWLRMPAVAFLCGLTAVVPAIVLELGYELIHGHHRWTHSNIDS